VSDGGYDSLINACTTATAINKTGVTYPTADGGLLPANP
jgi:hypothetical protein